MDRTDGVLIGLTLMMLGVAGLHMLRMITILDEDVNQVYAGTRGLAVTTISLAERVASLEAEWKGNASGRPAVE